MKARRERHILRDRVEKGLVCEDELWRCGLDGAAHVAAALPGLLHGCRDNGMLRMTSHAWRDRNTTLVSKVSEAAKERKHAAA